MRRIVASGVRVMGERERSPRPHLWLVGSWNWWRVPGSVRSFEQEAVLLEEDSSSSTTVMHPFFSPEKKERFLKN